MEKESKSTYESAEMEIVLVQSADIICTSLGGGSNEGFDDFEEI